MADDVFGYEAASEEACEKLEAEGFWEDVRRRYGITTPVVSQANQKKPSLGGGDGA